MTMPSGQPRGHRRSCCEQASTLLAIPYDDGERAELDRSPEISDEQDDDHDSATTASAR